MKPLLKLLFAVVFGFWTLLVSAQQLEIIQLRSKTADEVLPVLLPLVEPGATLTGTNSQLFLKASPRNRDDIKRALAAIDVPSRRLIIRIATDRQGEDAQAGGQVNLGGTRRSNAQLWDTRRVRGEQAGQSVQTVDGGRAFIQVGRTLAVPMRQVYIGPGGMLSNETTVYRDIGSGFFASPRVNGQRVAVDISQQAEAQDYRSPGGTSVQRLSTTVTGRLGEWIELGASGRQAAGQQSGTTSIGTNDVRESRSIWLMVEEAD